MALFGRKKNTKPVADTKKVVSRTRAKKDPIAYRVLFAPRITEKATMIADKHKAYVFDVSPRATKAEIKDAIIELYKVTPIAIRTVAIPKKKVVVRGIIGTRAAGRKAYVFLRKEDKIELI